MLADEKRDDELDTKPEELEDLEAPEQEGEEVKGGRPKIVDVTKTSNCVGG